MKKVLFATTALVLTAGTAMAEVSISGSGRVGLTYLEDRSPAVTTPARTEFRLNPATGVIEEVTIPASTTPAGNDTLVDMRLRFNIDASKETDAGVTFGGRIRMQYTQGNGRAGLSAAYVYAEASGFRVEVGNSNTAYDSVALMYNSEVGFVGNSQGDPQGSYFSFDSTGKNGSDNYIGVFASYSVGDLNARLSFVTEDQTGATAVEEEIGLSFDYKFGQFTVALAAAQNGGGIADNDLFFLGAEYAINDSTNVGLLFNDNGTAFGGDGNTITLYGNTKLASGIGLKGYISSIDSDAGTDEDIAIGVGADYDLGGATLAGGIEKRFDGSTYADIGVNFSF
jgi:outer membrane protein OmpU